MSEADKTIENSTRCPHFNSCSQNFCPLDLDLNLRGGGKQDKCRWMREPKRAKIQDREFVSGGAVMSDALLNFVPKGNLERLNDNSRERWLELQNKSGLTVQLSKT